MMQRFLPPPRLTVLLTVVWCLLVNKITVGTVLLGFALGVIIPVLTQPYWQNRPIVRRPFGMAAYVLIVLWDIVVANIVVAKIIIFKPNAKINSAWVRIPLDLQSPEAITILAGTITMTPGTVSCDLSAQGHNLLVHCLDAPNPDEVRDQIKQRYERRLKEIFE